MRRSDGPEVPRDEPLQAELFHYSPQQVCYEIGLNWRGAVRLHESGRLSFDPAQVLEMDEGQERELRFVGALAAAGCDERMLDLLLKTLRKPYHYSLARIYFDWLRCGRWRLIPCVADDRNDVLAEWIEELKDSGDTDGLVSIRDMAVEAIETLTEEDSTGTP